MPGRLDFLDGLRALAALWVVLGHARLLTLGWQSTGRWWAFPLDLLLYAHLAVVVFLVLSGFCLALPVVRNGARLPRGQLAFFKARAWRILPPYYATLVLLLLVNAVVPIAHWGRHPVGLTTDISWQVLATNFLLLQDVFGQFNAINGPFWSIAVEWHLYFVFPALVWVLRRHGVAALLASGAAAGAVLTWLSFAYPRLSDAVPASIPQPPYFIVLFAIGVASAALALRPRCEAAHAGLRRRALAACLVFAFALWALVWRFRIVDGKHVNVFLDQLHWIDPLAGLAAGALLVGVSSMGAGQRLRALLERRWLVGVGGYSYSLYLTHVPILASINQLLKASGLWDYSRPAAFVILATGGTLASLLFARGFARLVEVRYKAMR